MRREMDLASVADLQAPAGWLRILHLGGDSWLGLAGGDLFAGSYGAPSRRIETDCPIALLPCLAKRRPVVIAELRSRELELGFNEGALVDLVPLDAIPSAAVASEMDYWMQLALDWLAETHRDNPQEELLRAVEGAAWATQRARHRATSLRTTPTA
jgi:hypothetical protein